MQPWIVFQQRFYVPLGITFGFVLPLALGFLWEDPLGALFVVSFLRLVIQYHAAFSVNSFAHAIGSQPYSTNDSSRDSLVTLFFTLGEGGNHNFHHRFPSDYRNGVRPIDYDPTKWFIWVLSLAGLASCLKLPIKSMTPTR